MFPEAWDSLCPDGACGTSKTMYTDLAAINGSCNHSMVLSKASNASLTDLGVGCFPGKNLLYTPCHSDVLPPQHLQTRCRLYSVNGVHFVGRTYWGLVTAVLKLLLILTPEHTLHCSHGLSPVKPVNPKQNADEEHPWSVLTCEQPAVSAGVQQAPGGEEAQHPRWYAATCCD